MRRRICLFKSVFDGEFHYLGRFKDMPSEEPMPASEANKIMHVSFRISDETVLMGCDTIKAFGPPCLVGNNISISINTKSEEEAKKLFAELSVGGQVTMTLDKIFWGALFGMFTDQFGIN